MSLSRRTFLYYIGALAGGAACGVPFRAGQVPPRVISDSYSWSFTSVPYPVPLPGRLYSGSEGRSLFSQYTVTDTLSVPPGFSWRVLAQWGELFGPLDQPQHQIRFGYNCDYTALIPRAGHEGEYWLCVNHEYVSVRPWTQGYADVYGEKLPSLTLVPGTKEIII
jgi:secreted PhoX family phosphatase